MKKVITVVLSCVVFISITIGILVYYNSKSSNEDINALLAKANAEIFTFKYEFETDPYVLLLFKDDAMFFRIDKKSLESKEYNKSLKDNGGITFVLGNQKTAGAYKASDNALALNGKENQEAKKDLDMLLNKYKLNQESVYDYLVNYASDNLLKELADDKKSFEDLAANNNYTISSINKTISVDSEEYTMDITINNNDIENAVIYSHKNKKVCFIVPKTNSLGTNLVSMKDKNIIYDLDSGKVVKGSGTIEKSELEQANLLKEECYKMMRYLHINSTDALLKFYSEVKK